jgi:phosphatidylglycerophosphate synthase
MLARARHKESEYGAFLDLVFDRVTEFFLIAGYAYGFYRATGRQSVFVLGLVAAGLYFLQISVYYLLKLYYGDPTPGDTAESRALLLFLAALFGVMNRLDLGIYTLFTVSVTVNAVLLIRFLRSRRA